MAPELVADSTRVTEKADVWSVGMVMWEMLTREVPFQNLNPQQIISGLMMGSLQPVVSAHHLRMMQQHMACVQSFALFPILSTVLQKLSMALV